MSNRRKTTANQDATGRLLHALLEQIPDYELEESGIDNTFDEVDSMYRTTKIYLHYYTSKLTLMQQRRVVFNVAIVILAISSVVMANSFCAYPVGHILLIVTTSSLVLVAVITLAVDHPSKTVRYLETIKNYQVQYVALGKLVAKIELRRESTETERGEFTGLAQQAKALILNSPEAIPDRRLIEALAQVVSPVPIPVKALSVPRKPKLVAIPKKSATEVARVWPIVKRVLLFVVISTVILIALIYLFLLIRFRLWHP